MGFDIFNAYSRPKIQVKHAVNEIFAVLRNFLFRFVEANTSFYLPQ